MKMAPHEILYRRINLLSSLMLAGWLLLCLALAIAVILLYGNSRLAERTMQERIDDLGRQVADLRDRAGPPPASPDAPSADASPTAGSAAGGTRVTRQPAQPTAQTRPMTPPTQTAISPVAGQLDPDPARPPGVRGLFFDLRNSVAADDQNPMFLLIIGPKTVESTLAELVKLAPHEAAQAGVPVDDRTLAAQLFLQTRNNEQAHRWAAATTQADGLAGQAWLVAGLASARMRQHDRAIHELTSAVRRLPDRPEPLKGLGEAYLAAGRPAEAIETYKKAVDAVPDDTALASRLVDLLIAERQLDEAIRRLRRIIATDPRQSADRARLAQLLLDKEQVKDALAVLDATPDNAPADARLDIARGQALMAGNQLPAAEAAIEKAVAKDALSAEAWRLLGLIRLQQAKNAAAVIALERSIAIKSDNPTTWEYLGVALANDGKLDEAIEKLQEVVRLNVSSAQMQYTLAVLYAWKKQPDAAVAALKQAILLDKNFLNRARNEQVFMNEPADSPIARFLKEPGQ